MARKPRTVDASNKLPVYGPSIRPTAKSRDRLRDSDAPRVQHIHASLLVLLPEYALIMDCTKGEAAMKRHDSYWGNWQQYALFDMPEFAQSNLYNGAGVGYIQKYLPKPNPTDLSEENTQRYRDYIERAVFYNVTGHTLASFVSAVFLRAPRIALPPAIEELRTDISGSGVSLIQSAKAATGLVMAYGRAGVLADFPTKDGVITQADKNAKRYRATLNFYAPWAIINWRNAWIDGKQKLILVVLVEPGLVKNNDDFCQSTTEQYRVLRLTNNVYSVELWRRNLTTNGETGGLALYSNVIPTDAAGVTFDYIPFSFIGAHDNTSAVDTPPMADIAHINRGHYRNSADYEESVYQCGQPTLVLSGLTQDWVDNVLGGQVVFGSRAAVPLPVGSKAEMIQAEPNNLAEQAMLNKEAQMRSLGAKLIEEKRVQKTATEAGYDEAATQSVLASSVANVSQAYLWALQQMCRFEGQEYTDVTLVFELNNELDLIKPSPEARKQLLTEYESGAIAWPEYRAGIRRAGIATMDDDEAQKSITANPPLAAALVMASVVKTATNDKTAP